MKVFIYMWLFPLFNIFFIILNTYKEYFLAILIFHKTDNFIKSSVDFNIPTRRK